MGASLWGKRVRTGVLKCHRGSWLFYPREDDGDGNIPQRPAVPRYVWDVSPSFM